MSEQDPGEDEPKPTLVLDSGAGSARFLQSIAPKEGPPRFIDPVTATPELEGPHGKAWLINLPTARLRYGLDAAKDGTLLSWVIEAPWAHPIWHSYSINLVHLRHIPGAPPIHFYLEGATHEFWLHALDPGDPPFEGRAARRTHRETLIRGGLFGAEGAPGFLTPMNFGAQFISDTDEAAAERVRSSVKAIVDGVLSPDTDRGADWMSIWGEAMIKPAFR